MPERPATDADIVYVIDDDPAALDSLCMLLRVHGLKVQGFTSAEEFLSALDPRAGGCVITDLRGPRMDGAGLIRALKAAGAPLPVIAVTGRADVGPAVSAMKAGAVDVIEKPYEADDLLRLLFDTLDARDDAGHAAARAASARRRLARLTPRERQVLQLVLDDKPDEAIAAALGISPRTVEVYRASAMQKVGAASLAELVRLSFAAAS